MNRWWQVLAHERSEYAQARKSADVQYLAHEKPQSKVKEGGPIIYRAVDNTAKTLASCS